MLALLEAIMNAKHANLTPNGRRAFITPPTPACCSTSRSPAEQLDLQALHRVRERLVSQRTG
jgi:hypothetical protein